MVLILSFGLVSCGNDTPVIDENETANKEWLDQVDKATDGQELEMQGYVNWQMDIAQLLDAVEGPYYDDTETYISVVLPSALPATENWKNEDGTLNIDAFAQQDVKAYYVIDNYLSEYGYQAYDATLYQYDFLKEYYTKKYGEPYEEEFVWNDENYKPTGKEDLYEEFVSGKVRVMAMWDIKELDTVLVVDWLNDPMVYDNNFGQISFYPRSEDFDPANVEDIDL